MGMDWHSSGITTSVMGALKKGLNPRHTSSASTSAAAAASSRATRRTNCARSRERTSLDGDALVRTSRLTARIDNNAVADGFQIYLHSFVLTSRRRVGGRAAGDERSQPAGPPLSLALGGRPRLHRRSAHGDRRPHAGTIMNLVDREARPAQEALLAIAREDPSRTLAEVRRLDCGDAASRMPAHHDVRAADVNEKRLGAVLALAHERDLRDFASFLLLEQLGPRTLQSLALIAEVVHGTPTTLRRSGTLRIRARRQGRPSVPGAAEGLRRVDCGPATRARLAKLGHTDKLGGCQASRCVHSRDRNRHAPRPTWRRRSRTSAI